MSTKGLTFKTIIYIYVFFLKQKKNIEQLFPKGTLCNFYRLIYMTKTQTEKQHLTGKKKTKTVI